MKHNVIIETSQEADDAFRAYIVEGPKWAIGWCSTATDKTREGAVHALRRDLQWERPRDTFDFLHARM